jgi:hypothetical protein
MLTSIVKTWRCCRKKWRHFKINTSSVCLHSTFLIIESICQNTSEHSQEFLNNLLQINRCKLFFLFVFVFLKAILDFSCVLPRWWINYFELQFRAKKKNMFLHSIQLFYFIFFLLTVKLIKSTYVGKMKALLGSLFFSHTRLSNRLFRWD